MGLPGCAQRQKQGSLAGFRPSTGRKTRDPFFAADDQLRTAGIPDFLEWPEGGWIRDQNLRGSSGRLAKRRSGRKAGVVAVHQVQQVKRNVGGVTEERFGGDLTSFLRSFRFGSSSTELAQSRQAAIIDHAFAGFRYGAEDSADASELGPDGAIRECEVTFFAG